MILAHRIEENMVELGKGRGKDRPLRETTSGRYRQKGIRPADIFLRRDKRDKEIKPLKHTMSLPVS